MKSLKLMLLCFCLAINNVTHAMQVKLHFLKSIKKTTLLLATASYLHTAVTQEKDFSKLPKISLQSINEYFEKWCIAIDNTKESLGLDRNKNIARLMTEKIIERTPSHINKFVGYNPIQSSITIKITDDKAKKS